MSCLFCNMPDRQYDLAGKKHITPRPPEEAKEIICSICVQVLSFQTQEKLSRAYQLALDKGMFDKAKVLETFLEEEDQDDGETKKSKRNLIRESPLRVARPALNKIGA